MSLVFKFDSVIVAGLSLMNLIYLSDFVCKPGLIVFTCIGM